jgi:hypothetical protein
VVDRILVESRASIQPYFVAPTVRSVPVSAGGPVSIRTMPCPARASGSTHAPGAASPQVLDPDLLRLTDGGCRGLRSLGSTATRLPATTRRRRAITATPAVHLGHQGVHDEKSSLATPAARLTVRTIALCTPGPPGQPSVEDVRGLNHSVMLSGIGCRRADAPILKARRGKRGSHVICRR